MGRRRPYVTGYLNADGVWRDLRKPNGEPTAGQLAWLNLRGMLDIVAPAAGAGRISKGEAAAAIKVAQEREAAARGELETTDPTGWGEASAAPATAKAKGRVRAPAKVTDEARPSHRTRFPFRATINGEAVTVWPDRIER